MSLYKNARLDNRVDSLQFDLSNKSDKIQISLANAIRRVILADIPVVAIDRSSIEIEINSSPFHNDMLIRRLELTPIILEGARKYDFATLEMMIDVNNETDEIMSVYPSDFTFQGDISADQIVVSNKVLLLKLKPGQQIKLKALFVESTAHENGASFAPASVAIYTFGRDEKVVRQKLSTAEDKDEFLYREADKYYAKTKSDAPLVYHFTIESIGMMSPHQIFNQALIVLNEKLARLKNRVINGEDIEIVLSSDAFDGVDFNLKDEDDTLGNLLSSYLANIKGITFSGYDKPHPHENLVKIQVASDSAEQSVERCTTLFLQNIDGLTQYIEVMRKAWLKVKVKTISKKKVTKRVTEKREVDTEEVEKEEVVKKETKKKVVKKRAVKKKVVKKKETKKKVVKKKETKKKTTEKAKPKKVTIRRKVTKKKTTKGKPNE